MLYRAEILMAALSQYESSDPAHQNVRFGRKANIRIRLTAPQLSCRFSGRLEDLVMPCTQSQWIIHCLFIVQILESNFFGVDR